MKEKRNLHKKVQELCDCFLTTDPLKEMSALQADEDKDEAALKWIALAVLHGINDHAEKISIIRNETGDVEVEAKYGKSRLPSPGPEIGQKVIEAVKQIAHFEEEEGKTPLSLGIRDSSIEIKLKLKKEKNGEKVSFKFPD
jgi:hypothetical protein